MSDPSELNICVFTCTEKGSGLHVHGRKLLQTADSHFRTMRARPSEKQSTKISKIAASEVGGVFLIKFFSQRKYSGKFASFWIVLSQILALHAALFWLLD